MNHPNGIYGQPFHGLLSILTLALCGAVGCGAIGCSGDGASSGTDGASKADAGVSAASGLSKKVAGPCSTTHISSAGKTYKQLITYKWDAKGRAIEEKSGPGATDLGADIYTKKWVWGADDKLASEFYETTGSDPNYDSTYTYDDKGRKATVKGTHTTYGTQDCKFEYATESKDHDLLCSFEYDEKDDEGNVTGTVKGTYAIEYIYGMQQITEKHSDGKGGTPSQVTQRFDKEGRLIAIELDSTLRGYPEHITGFTYNDKGWMATKTIDSDADNKPELTTTFTYDAYGNAVKAVTMFASGTVNHTLTHDYSCW